MHRSCVDLAFARSRTRRVTRVGFLLVLLAITTAITACGGGNGSPAATNGATASPSTRPSPGIDATGYERRMQALGQKLRVCLVTRGQGNVNATPQQAGANIARVQARMRKALAKLRAMNPPPAIRGQHERLIAAVREYARDLDEIIARLRAGDRNALAEIPRLPGIRHMAEATEAITRAGYDITGTGGISG